MVKIDPYNHKEKYKKWRVEQDGKFPETNENNSQIFRDFLDDMEVGANVSSSSKKGPRSYIRLNNIKSRMHAWAVILKRELNIDYIPELEQKERELLQLVKRMHEGEIYGMSPDPISAPGSYIKVLKAFWHWYERTQKKEGKDIRDITVDLDSRDKKPKFNYFTIEDVRKMCTKASYDYRVMMMFLFDTGIRAPTEMMNIRVCDLEQSKKDEFFTLSIPDEASKTFGRRIKLLICSDLLKEYFKTKDLKPNDYLFTKRPQNMNNYLRKLGFKLLNIGLCTGTKKDRKGTHYFIKNGLTMYDFRHSSACYWLPRYKSESALKYRFGWKKSEMVHYYTELLGMKDTIEKDDLYVDVTKTELEKQLQDKGKEINVLQDEIKAQNEAMKRQEAKIGEMMKILEALQIENKIKSEGKRISFSEFSI